MRAKPLRKLVASEDAPKDLRLRDGSRVAVIGGGPAGSFFSIFLLDMAKHAGLELGVDIYEPRDFSSPAPQGCNMCGGIVSESLVQTLATEGINLPPSVVQRGIDSYVLHMDVGTVHIDTPLHEKRIAAVYRGLGPRDVAESRWQSFDGYLQGLATQRGATVIRAKVTSVSREHGRPRIESQSGAAQTYDLAAVAVGVNAASRALLKEFGDGYRSPGTTVTFIREYRLGAEAVRSLLGNSMHVFLLDIPRLEFAAIIPKGDYLTICLLGEAIDKELVAKFLQSPEVAPCLPADLQLDARSCQCAPRINVRGARRPFADRLVFVGDCGVARLYKDGIGAAYRTAKAAATTAVFQGISAENFRRHFGSVCRSISTDNFMGRITFTAARGIQKSRLARRAVWRMTVQEQTKEGRRRRMSQVLWDLFTGSAPYKDIFLSMLKPAFMGRLASDFFAAVTPTAQPASTEDPGMDSGALGKVYEDGEVIVRQGDEGNCMYVLQEGRAQVLREQDGKEVPLRILESGEIFGEMAICDREVRSATVRALGRARLITVDRKNFLRRVHEDPALALHIVQTMSRRIRELTDEVARLKE